MKIFEAYPGMYRFTLLPDFAAFILQSHIEGFVRKQIRLGYELNIPILINLLKIYSEDDLIQRSIITSSELLNYLIKNQAYEQISESMDKWLKDQLEIIGKFEIEAEDITLINYIRQQSLKEYIPLYTTNAEKAMAISNEIDLFATGATTTACNIYMNILKEKIEEESNFSSKLIEASPAITYLYDVVSGREVFITGKVKEVMGFDPEELRALGNDFIIQRAHPEDISIIRDHIKILSGERTNKMHLLEFRFLHKDGRYRWLRTYEVVFKRDGNGGPTEVLGKIFEFSKEKETAIELEKRENQLLEAQSIAHIGSYEWNMEKNVSFNSPEVFRIFEMTEEQKYEQFLSYVHPDDLDKVKGCIKESFSTGHYECEYRYVKNGREKVIWSLGKVHFENNHAIKMVGTVQDVTEIKSIEKELIRKTTQLEKSNESLQQFAYVASHDLKEPLRKINMFADIILSGDKNNLSDSSRANLLKVQNAANSMRKMVDDVLSFSILEDGQVKVVYSLKKILNEVLDLLDQSIQEKHAKVISDELPEALIIPSQIKQLFQNLISNSLKFSRQDILPEITIVHKWIHENEYHLDHAEAYLELTFRDNGIGFPSEYYDKIFELFRRLHTSKAYEGSGLGLAIAKKIVDNHQGIIKVDSVEGMGSCFKIILPQKKLASEENKN